MISVTREGVEIIPDGNTILKAGDEIEILVHEDDIVDVEEAIETACHTVREI